MSYTRNYDDQTTFLSSIRKNGITTDLSVSRHLLGSRTGERMPDWKDKLRRGVNATTNFSSDRYRFEDLKAGAVLLTASIPGNPGAGNQVHEFKGWGFPPADVLAHLTPDQATAEAEALRIVYNKIRSTSQQWAGASFLVEFGDVLRQFGAPFASIVDLTNKRLNRLELEARGLRGSISFRKAKYASIVASTWLEYAFGLAPLISDTKKAAEALARLRVETEDYFHPREKAVGRGSSVKTTHNIQQSTPGSGWIVGDNVTITSTEHRVQYVVGLDSTVHAAYGSNERLRSLMGFNPIDWVPAAWEGVPWSWLIDYFTNVGDILQAGATNTVGVTWISKAVTDVTTRESVMTLNLPATKSFCNAQGWPYEKSLGTELGSSKTVRTSVTRYADAQLSVPPLVFSIPNPVSEWNKYVNVIAVILQKRPQASALWIH